MTLYLGMDVHSKATVWVAMDEAGRVTGEGSVATTAEGLAEMVVRAGAERGTAAAL
jgi:hypothetical protein